MGTPYVVVDVETTGFGRGDRIVEVAAVTLDSASGQIIDEYDTLVNPERDTGPVDVHGVTASMVEAAPSFEEIAGSLAHRLDGAVLVAHNISFDARMLSQEYQRLGVHFEQGSGICTYRATAQKLPNACRLFGVELSQHHRALSDARATAGLMLHLLDEAPATEAVSVDYGQLAVSQRTLRREAGATNSQDSLARLAAMAPYPSSDAAVLVYLALLDWVLDDLVITAAERSEMSVLARTLGLSSGDVSKAHSGYVASIVAAAQRDNVITDSEQQLISKVVKALEVDDFVVPEITNLPDCEEMNPGMRVCFTGQAVVAGQVFVRSDLEERAAVFGLQPVSSVTKKGCDLLVAADTASMSGKAKKARALGIPVMSIKDFLDETS